MAALLQKCGDICMAQSPRSRGYHLSCIFCDCIFSLLDDFVDHIEDEHQSQIDALEQLTSETLDKVELLPSTSSVDEQLSQIDAVEQARSETLDKVELLPSTSCVYDTRKILLETTIHFKSRKNRILHMKSASKFVSLEQRHGDTKEDIMNSEIFMDTEGERNELNMHTGVEVKNEICSATEIGIEHLLKEETEKAEIVAQDEGTTLMEFESMFIECSDNADYNDDTQCQTEIVHVNENSRLSKGACVNAPAQMEQSFEESNKFLSTYDKDTLLSILSSCPKHPILWDTTTPHSKNIRFRERAYKSIANDIGKLKDWRNIRDLIKSLRVRIHNELRKKLEAESKGELYTPLWELDIVSFLPKKKKKWEATTQKLIDIDDEVKAPKSNCSDTRSDIDDLYDEQILDTAKRFDKKTMLAIFSSYDKHSILWDLDDRMRRNVRLRVKAYKSIASEVGMQEDWENIRDFIRRLSHRLHAEQKQKLAAAAKNQFYVPLWKHDMFAFLKLGNWKRKSENMPKRRSTLPYTKLTDLQCLKLIKMYKSHLCLWDEQEITYRFKNRRKEALFEIRETLNNEENIALTQDELDREIFRIRKICSIEKALKQECKNSNMTYKPKCKFYKEISFLEVDVGPFTCYVCSKVTSGATQYKIHKSSHDGSLPFICPVCSHGFKEVCNFTVHLRRHQRDYDLVCKECNKGFASSTELSMHIGIHSSEPSYFCEICGQSFRTKRGKHLHTHTKRSPRFKCEICPKTYLEKRGLEEHMNFHMDIRNNICNVCGKKFRSKRQLSQHKDIHSEQKKHVCIICGKCFAQRAGLCGHMRSHGTALASWQSTSNALVESE